MQTECPKKKTNLGKGIMIYSGNLQAMGPPLRLIWDLETQLFSSLQTRSKDLFFTDGCLWNTTLHSTKFFIIMTPPTLPNIEALVQRFEHQQPPIKMECHWTKENRVCCNDSWRKLVQKLEFLTALRIPMNVYSFMASKQCFGISGRETCAATHLNCFKKNIQFT